MLAQAVSGLADPVPLPDTKQCSSSSSCHPAECHPVQLATQAGSTRRPALLISFSIFRFICTGSCTSTHGKKRAKTAFTSQSHCSYSHLFFQLLKILFFFFVHPVEFNLPRGKSLGDGNAHIHEVKFKFKDEINKIKAFSLFSS